MDRRYVQRLVLAHPRARHTRPILLQEFTWHVHSSGRTLCESESRVPYGSIRGEIARDRKFGRPTLRAEIAADVPGMFLVPVWYGTVCQYKMFSAAIPYRRYETNCAPREKDETAGIPPCGNDAWCICSSKLRRIFDIHTT